MIIKTCQWWVVSTWFWRSCSWQLRTGSRATVVIHFIVPTTSQRGQRLYLLYSMVYYGVPDWEAARSPWGSLGSPLLLVLRGRLWSRNGTLWWVVLCEGYYHSSFPRYRGGIEAHGDMLWSCVLWEQWYIPHQSKNIRIAVPAVMGGSNNVFRD